MFEMKCTSESIFTISFQVSLFNCQISIHDVLYIHLDQSLQLNKRGLIDKKPMNSSHNSFRWKIRKFNIKRIQNYKKKVMKSYRFFHNISRITTSYFASQKYFLSLFSIKSYLNLEINVCINWDRASLELKSFVKNKKFRPFEKGSFATTHQVQWQIKLSLEHARPNEISQHIQTDFHRMKIWLFSLCSLNFNSNENKFK